MKKHKEFEKWANKKLQEIQKVLFLEHFDLKPIKPVKQENDGSSSAFNFPYQTIQIEYSKALLEDWKKNKKDDVLGVLVHEMCHSLTDPLYGTGYSRFISKDEIENTRERLTDHIANVVLKHKLI